MAASVRITRGTNEPVSRVALGEAGRERVGLALLGGPHCVLDVLEEASSHGAEPPEALLIDVSARHAEVDLAAFHPDLEADLCVALAHVLRGLWEAFGWGLSAGPLDEASACPVRRRALWRHFGPKLEQAGLPAERHVAELLRYLQRGFSVELDDGLPELVSHPGQSPVGPPALCFAFGGALLQHRPDPDGAAAPSPPLEPAWSSLHEAPQHVATLLAEVNGMSAEENLDNLEAAVEDALRERGIKLDVWARFREVDADTREGIVRDVLRMFRNAGML